MTITKEHLKTEIDALPDQFVMIIYHILRTFTQVSPTSLMSTAPSVASTDSANVAGNHGQDMIQSTHQKSHSLLGLFPNAGVTVGDLTEPLDVEWDVLQP
ncbi:MAG: hypothetical protein AAF639_17830 [Chloroflexota bacterium]